ncbi:MAG: DUF1700 domain-containing protein [Lachnospiraceae bacterium]|nr:DUF1700 domain-containing protein [Lachnospiraceae bacterium]
MTKSEFLAELRNGLESCPEQEREERITFYDEMISDLMEEGYSEEDAVGKIGNPGEIAANIMDDIPLSVLVKQRIKPRRTLKGWEILLIILGFPIWFSLGIAAIAVIFSIYAVMWSLVLALYAVDLAFAVSAIGCFIYGFMGFSWFSGLFCAGTGIFLAGAAAMLFVGCIVFTKFMVRMTKSVCIGIKNLFIKK